MSKGDMRELGIVRPVDELGRICLPKEMRRYMGLVAGSPLAITAPDSDTMVLKRYAPNCIFCGSDREIREFKGKNVCGACWTKLHQLGPETGREQRG